MKTSQFGRGEIARREGTVLTAYPDSVGVLTIGTGHTSAAGDPKVTKGMKISAWEADQILTRDLAKFEAVVSKAVTVKLNQNEFDALVSLAFNIGGGAFAKSTLVRKLNQGDRIAAANQFLVWNKAGGKTLKGLTTRRQDERRQFLNTMQPEAPASPPPVPVEAPKPVPATPEPPKAQPGPAVTPEAQKPSKETIEAAQKRLADLGYNPGGVDGKLGPLTSGAILSFKNDNGLTPDDIIDDTFLAAMATASPRKLAPARENATIGEVAAKIPEANVHWWNRLGALIIGLGTTAAGAVDYIAPATSYLTPVKNFVGDVPAYVWIVSVVGLCAVLYVGSQYGAKKAKEAFNAGDRR